MFKDFGNFLGGTGLICYFFWKKIKQFERQIHEEGQKREREGGIRSFIWVSHMDIRDPHTWAIFRCFPRHLSKELNRKWSIWTWTDAHMWCQHQRLWLHHNATMHASWVGGHDYEQYLPHRSIARIKWYTAYELSSTVPSTQQLNTLELTFYFILFGRQWDKESPVLRHTEKLTELSHPWPNCLNVPATGLCQPQLDQNTVDVPSVDARDSITWTCICCF